MPARHKKAPKEPPAPKADHQMRANSKTLHTTIKKRNPSNRLATQLTNARPPGFLPPAVAKQPALAQKAFIMQCHKPGRSLVSIAKELGTSAHTLHAYARSANWAQCIALVFTQDAEALHLEAKHEARRSRGELLASNALREGAMQAALEKMIELDDSGKVTLKPGVDIQDIQRLQMAMTNHLKVTMLLTGEEQSLRRGVAQASQAKIVIDMKNVVPEPIPVSGEVIR